MNCSVCGVELTADNCKACKEGGCTCGVEGCKCENPEVAKDLKCDACSAL